MRLGNAGGDQTSLHGAGMVERHNNNHRLDGERPRQTWPGPVMLLLLRDYATFDYAKFAILERDYATHYASIIRYATKAPNHFLGGLC